MRLFSSHFFIHSQRQPGVVALVPAQLARRGVVERPDEAEDDGDGPAFQARDAQDLARPLVGEAVVDLREEGKEEGESE